MGCPKQNLRLFDSPCIYCGELVIFTQRGLNYSQGKPHFHHAACRDAERVERIWLKLGRLKRRPPPAPDVWDGPLPL